MNGPDRAYLDQVGKPAPDFTLPTAEGEYLSLQELRGRRVILVFLRHFAWVPWREHLAQLRQRYNQIVDSGGEVAAVSFEPRDRLQQLRRQMQLPFPLLSDPERDVYRAYGLERGSWRKIFAPKTILAYAAHFLRGGGYHHQPSDWKQLGGDFVLDKDGKVIFEHRGESPHDRPSVDELVRVMDVPRR